MARSLLRKPDPMGFVVSSRHPQRVPTWDAIVLTVASPDQAQLRRAKRMERISHSISKMAVPDPHGAHIGSGAATLSAIQALPDHLAQYDEP
ncbi:hypothetical protein SUGI_1086910 [Cryptomeria japonica]|nr:hypothetical protein SUGI_1086910 [Cryptomeria japonica]